METTKCVVSGMEMEINDSALRATYEGKDYYVCCEHCLEAFNKNPQKYVQN
ncbi:YHS domain-containing protein [Bacillus andreraoultii]|uniref:YHS domain-containing protein n=1 Tax=Bacillus andreraoultii TaxID=1499685 RepID=UPI0009462360|nr:YHS domain-containing protein [Bacillus andreraoultii]